MSPRAMVGEEGLTVAMGATSSEPEATWAACGSGEPTPLDPAATLTREALAFVGFAEANYRTILHQLNLIKNTNLDRHP